MLHPPSPCGGGALKHFVSTEGPIPSPVDPIPVELLSFCGQTAVKLKRTSSSTRFVKVP